MSAERGVRVEPSRARAWGRLFRLSLAPTAAADVLAGLALAGGGALPGAGPTVLLVLASLGVYHANMALNDWSDRARDRSSRPDRPLPSGAVPPRGALVVVVALCVVGIGAATAASPAAGAWMAGVCALAALYNLRGRGPWSGPLLLGACRGGNLALGFAYVGLRAVPAALWTAPLLYASYVFAVSRLGRLEDEEDRLGSGARPRRHLFTAAALLVATAALPIPGAGAVERLGALALALAAAWGVARRAREVSAWTPAEVGRSMGLALRRLLALTAAFAWLAGGPAGPFVALGILAGFPVSFALRNRFPPS